MQLDEDNFVFAVALVEDAAPRRLLQVDEDNWVWESCANGVVAGDAAGPGMRGLGCALVREGIGSVGN